MGLAAAGRLPAALERMAALKGRGEGHPFIGLIDEPGRLDGLVHSVPRYVAELVARHWPGPLTLVLAARPGVPLRAADGSIALRCPGHALTRALIREVAGLLASTSANRTGGAVARDAAEVRALFGVGSGGVALILDEDDERAAARDTAALENGDEQPGVPRRTSAGDDPTPSAPSTILDCRGPAPRVLRAGSLSLADLGLVDSEPPRF